MNAKEDGAGALERGEIARREKRGEDAELAFREAVDVFRRSGRNDDLAHDLTRLAQVERDAGRYADALDHQTAAVAICRSLNDRPRLPHAIRHLADIYHALGRHREADPHYVEMQALYKAMPSVPPLEIANAMRSVAIHAEAMGDPEESQRLWRDVRDRYAALDHELFRLTGEKANRAVAECDRHLADLAQRIRFAR